MSLLDSGLLMMMILVAYGLRLMVLIMAHGPLIKAHKTLEPGGITIFRIVALGSLMRMTH